MGFVWRGTNLIEHRLFNWRGADGTEILCYRFGAEGYCSYAKFVRQQRLDQPRFSPEQIAQRLEAFLDEEDVRTRSGPLLAFDGGDHMEWDPAAYAVLQQRREQPSGKYQIVHASLEEYIAELLSTADGIEKTLVGELRQTAHNPPEVDKCRVALGTGSSRVWIKQANARCETLLCRWAEPLASFAQAVLRIPNPDGFLEIAWKWLLQNHAHDSICGCSIDAVHDDMAYRFHQSEQIANRLTLEATRKLAVHVQGDVAGDELRCVVFNPLPRSFRQVAVLDLEIPTEWAPEDGLADGRTQPAFAILDEDGDTRPFQSLEVALDQPRFRVLDTAFPLGYCVHVARVALPLDIPALGYSTLTLRSAGQSVGASRQASGSAAVEVTGRSLANEFLSVTIEPDGTLTLLDRQTGNTYRDLLAIEDTADMGDGWNFRPAPNDPVLLSNGSQAEISQIYGGPLLAAFLVHVRIDVPEEYDFSTQARSKRHIPLHIESRVWLRAGARQVEIETTVHNTARDHRLRVLFPTQAPAATYLSDTPFDVVERPVALPPDNQLYPQPEVETRPQQSWTVVFAPVSEPARGLAALSTGLYESAVQDTPERAIALTLLRATRRTEFTAGEPGGQVQGERRFHYALIPLQGAPDRSELFDRAARLAAGLRTVQLSSLDLELGRAQLDSRGVMLPRRASYLALHGQLVLTSLRSTAAGLEARLFNPQTTTAQGELSLAGWPAECPRPNQAVWVDFESRPAGASFPLLDAVVPVTLAPKEIKTLCFYRAQVEVRA